MCILVDIKSEIFEYMYRNGYVGDSAIIICSDCEKGSLKNICDKLISIGFRVDIINYENFTSKRNSDCIEDALSNILKSYPFLNSAFLSIYKGKQGLYYIKNEGLFKWVDSVNKVTKIK